MIPLIDSQRFLPFGSRSIKKKKTLWKIFFLLNPGEIRPGHSRIHEKIQPRFQLAM
jgi:hypothetical protein